MQEISQTKRRYEAKPGREKLFRIIFQHDTKLGEVFDVTLIALIILSVIAVMLDSVGSIRKEYGPILFVIEWGFTVIFSFEFVARLSCIKNKRDYCTSFFGIIDMLAILPSYLALVLPGSQYFLVVRVFRVLRVFRILRLAEHVIEASKLADALKASWTKITVFIYSVVAIVVVVGSAMYVIETPESGFTSIPASIYWAIVTMTTVGYGDISPQTPLGQMLAAIVMIMGYAIIAVPTGIVTVEMQKSKAKYCKNCGKEI